jgi:hypothetical protein
MPFHIDDNRRCRFIPSLNEYYLVAVVTDEQQWRKKLPQQNRETQGRDD